MDFVSNLKGATRCPFSYVIGELEGDESARQALT